MYHFVVPAMKCGGCLGAITRSLQKIDPQAQVAGDLEERIIKVASDKAESLLLAALSNAGYPAQPVPQQEA
jgi:copper chaperone